jgi:membrane protease subunit HflC
MGELLNKYRFGLFGIAILAMLLASSFVVVAEDQQVVIERMGKPDRVINRFRPDQADGAGIVVKLPLIERAVWLPRGLLSVSHPSQKIRSTDQQWLMVDTDVTYRIINPVKLVETLGTADKADAQLKTMLPPLLEQALAQHSTGTIARPGAGGAAAQLTKALDAKARQYGIQVIDVRVARVTLEQASLTEALERMRDRQENAVYEIRKKSFADAASIVSQANADAATLLQKSAGRDPEFYAFFKAMRSCEEHFGQPPTKDSAKKDRPAIVLPPDCAYLKPSGGN